MGSKVWAGEGRPQVGPVHHQELQQGWGPEDGEWPVWALWGVAPADRPKQGIL